MDKLRPYLFSNDPFIFTKPKIITAGNYRVAHYEVSSYDGLGCKERGPYNSRGLPTYREDDGMVSCMEIDDKFDLRTTLDNKYVLNFPVALSLRSSIIGTGGLTLHRIEEDTKTFIEVPRRDELKDVVITGENERSVMSAKNRIEIIIREARNKKPFTHFISLPVVSDMIRENFDTFKIDLLNSEHIHGLDPTMFQNPNKFHLTIAPLVLLDEIEQNRAIEILRDCKDHVVGRIINITRPLHIHLEGVEIMNDDPTNVDVLYGKVTIKPEKYNNYFQEIANGIADYFATKGLSCQQNENVKLHVTLINTKYRRTDKQNNRSGSKRKRETFDASSILKKYKNFTFGSATLKNVHLSIRYTTGEDSYYKWAAVVPLY